MPEASQYLYELTINFVIVLSAVPLLFAFLDMHIGSAVGRNLTFA
jgi:hypothetical protein